MRDDLENPMVQGDYYALAEVCGTCDGCGGPIYEGDTFYLIDGAPVCAECIAKARRTA